MPSKTDFNPLDFFNALHRQYDTALQDPAQVDKVLALAFDRCEIATNQLADGLPALGCHKGCDTCCTLRVLATAPEIFLIAQHIMDTPDLSGVLPQRIAQANQATCGLDEPQRVALRRQCPFILSAGACCIYPVRPLACRGHASYSVEDCRAAAAGQAVEIAFSEPHQLVRSLVQNALQSALRDAGLAWGIYELNQGLHLALTQPSAFADWLAGQNPLAPAQVFDVSQEEMAETFDHLRLSRT